MLKEKIKQLSEDFYPQLVAIRRYLHTNPELSFEENNTSLFIEEKFRQLNIPYKKFAGNGIAGVLEFNDPTSVTIAIRADMDALPIQEENNVEYKSVNDGVMHACGHDVHMTSLLGALFILSEIKDELRGTLKVIFQPAEEKLPGGAKQMIEEGVLTDPEPEIIFAQHVFPELPAGSCGFHPGFYMSSSDEIYIKVTGKGGHAALFQNTINPIYISARIIDRFHEFTQSLDADKPALVSIGKFEARGANNIIPECAFMEGTIRTFDEGLRKEVHEKIMDIVYGEAEKMGGTAELEIRCGYPTLYNNPELTERLRLAAIDYMGKEKVHDISQRMTSEDFAYFALQKPAVMYRLGITNTERNIIYPLHSSKFDIDEEALKTGAGLMAYLAYKELKHE